jgi:hypothetical protein
MRRYVLDALNRAGPYGLGTTDASVVRVLDHVPVPTFGNLPNHRADETMFGQQVAIALGGVLRTPIRMSPERVLTTSGATPPVPGSHDGSA